MTPRHPQPVRDIVGLFLDNQLGRGLDEMDGSHVLLALFEHAGFSCVPARRQHSISSGSNNGILTLHTQYGVKVSMPQSKRGAYVTGLGKFGRAGAKLGVPVLGDNSREIKETVGPWRLLARQSLTAGSDRANRIDEGKALLDAHWDARSLQRTTALVSTSAKPRHRM